MTVTRAAKRRLLPTLLLSLALVAGLEILTPSAASAAAPTLTITPTKGSVGTRVTATGSGYSPNDEVEIWFDGNCIHPTPEDATTCAKWRTTGGKLNVTFAIPEAYPEPKRVETLSSRGFSNAVYFTVQLATPGQPQTKAYGAFHIKVGWVDTNTYETGYEINNGTSSVKLTANDLGSWQQGSTLWYSWPVSAPETSMCFSIRAYLAGGTPSAWASVCGKSGPPGPPAAPSAVTAIAINSSTIRIYWNDNATNETAFGFWNLTDEPMRWWVDSLPATGRIGAFDWTGLAPNTTMCFKVTAYNEYGRSDWGAPGEACATTTS
jgi:hypothetical protein